MYMHRQMQMHLWTELAEAIAIVIKKYHGTGKVNLVQRDPISLSVQVMHMKSIFQLPVNCLKEP